MDSAVSAFHNYKPRQPENELFHKLVRDNWYTYKEVMSHHPDAATIPSFVEKELEKFINCGVLSNGFIRLKCETCQEEHLLGLSCKGRLCPSCGGKRMVEKTLSLCEKVLPEQPYRQFVISFPYPLKPLLARNSALLSKVSKIACREISRFQLRKAQNKQSCQTGMITFIQLFGSALQLTPHLHILCLDGYYTSKSTGRMKFTHSASPTDEEISGLLSRIVKKVRKQLCKLGYLEQHGDREYGIVPDAMVCENIFEYAQTVVAQGKVGVGERCGQAVRRLGVVPEYFRDEQSTATIGGARCASLDGFSLHANTAIKAWQRERLENLVSYMCRPPISTDRLKLRDDGDVVYEFKRPWKDGSWAIILSPMEFMEKIVSLVPRPYQNMCIYSGVFGPRSRARNKIIRKPLEQDEDDKSKSSSSKTYTWAEAMAKVFAIDVSRCKCCGGKLKVVSACTKASVVRRILEHVGIGADPPSFAPVDPTKLGPIFSY